MATVFGQSGDLLRRFSDDQVDQGFWCLLSSNMIAEAAKTTQMVLPSFVPLFEQLIAVRCTPHLGHLEEPGANPLNGSCYMWWDLLRFALWQGTLWSSLHDEIVATQRRRLAIPHDACRESALHGFGHLVRDYPERREDLVGIIDQFLIRSPNLRHELVTYADRAKADQIL